MKNLLESLRGMGNNPKVGNIYSTNMGIRTAANPIFFVKHIESTDDPKEALIITKAGDKIRIEKEILYPLIRGRNIDAWQFETSDYILWTHDEEGNVREELPPRAEEYFKKEKIMKKLKDRKTSSIARKLERGAPPWIIGDVSSKKLKNKVVWQKISHSLEATYLPSEIESEVGERKLIPTSSVYFIGIGDDVQALSLTGILNSVPARTYVASYVNRTGAADCQHFAWILGCLPIPEEVEEGKTKELAEIAKKLQEKGEEEENLTRNLNSEVARLYGLSEDELSKMKDFLEFFTED